MIWHINFLNMGRTVLSWQVAVESLYLPQYWPLQGSTSVLWERELMGFRLLFHTPEIIRNINKTGRDVLTWVIFTFVVSLWRNGKILTKRLREGLWVSWFTILRLRDYSPSLYCFWWMKEHFPEVPATAWRNWWHDVILVDSDGKVISQSLNSALCYVQILESVKRASEIALQCQQCRSMILWTIFLCFIVKKTWMILVYKQQVYFYK